MRISFSEISSSQEKRVRGLLKPLLRFMPFWVHEVAIDEEESDSGLLASAGFDKEYRRTLISLSAGLLAMDDEEVVRVMTHEICHAYNEPIYKFFKDVLPTYLTQEQYNGIQPLYTREMESQTEDLAIMLGSLNE